MNSIRTNTPRNQQGVSTLLIAMLMLGILTVVTIFATVSGVNEQRTSGNEYRYKLAFQASEAGLNQAIEFLKVNTRQMLSSTGTGWFAAGSERWIPCASGLPAGMTVDPCLAEPNLARRSNMYRYVGGTGGVLPLSEVLPAGASQTFTSTGGTVANGGAQFATTYRTYATLCRLDMSLVTPVCALAPVQGSAFYVTAISVGALTDESSTATVKQSYGTFRLLGGQPAAPLIAAGTAIGLGNAQIIPNPDAAGFGVPISVWAKGNADVSGASFATCQLGEWLANDGTPTPSAQNLLDGVCESCTCNGLCPGYGLLSGNASSCQGSPANNLEGEDVLDVDAHTSNAGLRDSKYFPDDLFAYIFGVPSSAADAYLTQNATAITDCSTLNASSSGLYWYTTVGGTCSLPNSTTVGSLENPVVLVSNGRIDKQGNDPIFGLLYVRSVAGTGELLKITGGSKVYGSVVLEGAASMGGSPTIVYNKTVLENIFNSPKFTRYGPIPGSWSDDVELVP